MKITGSHSAVFSVLVKILLPSAIALRLNSSQVYCALDNVRIIFLESLTSETTDARK
ncbi:hypothetical protein MAR_005196 [Mya arenaria]|uniref:Uncharacterized protein n=1 Tax=Mya arenaria TaxID=6604 RepID=A0ABY7F227_MYAAR|nr:hypothetical protein MAR_005196 [Mya arenaria]